MAFHQERRYLPLLLHPQVSCDSPASARYHDRLPRRIRRVILLTLQIGHARMRGPPSSRTCPRASPELPQTLTLALDGSTTGSAAPRNRTVCGNCAFNSNATSFTPSRNESQTRVAGTTQIHGHPKNQSQARIGAQRPAAGRRETPSPSLAALRNGGKSERRAAPP